MQLRSGAVVYPSFSAALASSSGTAAAAPAPPAPPQAPHSAAPAAAAGAGAGAGAQAEAAFVEGVRLCLGRWTALQLAVEHSFGGRSSREKAQVLGQDIVAWFGARARTRADGSVSIPSEYDLEEFLDEGMLELFNTELEDGSLEEVAAALVKLYEECSVANFSTVLQWQQEALRAANTGAAQSVRGSQSGDTDELNSSEEEEEEEEEEGDVAMVECEKSVPAHGEAGPSSSGVPQRQGPERQGGGAGGGGGGDALGAGGSSLCQDELDSGWQQVPTRKTRNNRK